LQIEAAAGSIASGHMEPDPLEHAWDPYVPPAPATAEHGHSAPAKAGQEAVVEKAVNG
jgi:hypothetical protein